MAECRRRHIVEIGLTLLHQASMSLTHWTHVFCTTVYLINHLPNPTHHYISPYAKLFDSMPNYLKLRTFGYLCYLWLRPYNSHKLEPKSKLCVFLGYSSIQSAFLCLHPSSGRLYTSRHVTFQETIFSFTNITSSLPRVTSSMYENWDTDAPPSYYVPITHDSHTFQTQGRFSASLVTNTIPLPLSSSNLANTIDSILFQPIASPSPFSSSPLPPTRIHPMITRSCNNIFKPNLIHSATKHPLPESLKPICVSQAICDPNWRAAMSKEFNALLHNYT